MDSTRTFGMLALVTLGGCIISYDYEDKEPVGTSASSSGTSSGTSSSGSFCDYGTCLRNEWAHRYGIAAENQTAAGVAFDAVGNIVLAGTYGQSSFDVGTFAIDPLTTSTSDGFLAWIKPDGQSALWAGSLSLGTIGDAVVKDLAVDTDGFAIAVGFGLNSAGVNNGRIQKRQYTANSATIAWIEGQKKDTKIYAVTTAGTSVYVVGTASDEPLSCNGVSLSPSPGMFIAKFLDDNNGGLTCVRMQLIKKDDAVPTAVVAIPSGAGPDKIWVTGTFTNEATAPHFEWTLSGGNAGTFLMAVKGDDLTVLKGTSLNFGMGVSIRAHALALGPTGSNAGTHLFLAGEYSGGKPDNLPASTGPAAFVADFFDADMVPFKQEWAKGITATDLIRATGVAFYSDKLYLAGTSAGTVDLGAKQLQFASAQIHPYLAVFKDVTVSAASLAGFDVFPSSDEFTADRAMHIAASPSGVVMAGAWAHDVDFSTTSETTGFVQALPGEPKTLDAVVAKFAYQ